VRAQAAADLRVQVTSYNQEFPGHDGAKGMWQDVFHRTFDLTRSNTLFERLGATLAIGETVGSLHRRLV
jgi:FKBP12-rapamycin complex-associated protein